MFSRPTPLWPLLTQLGTDAPFWTEKIEARLGVRLTQTAQNDFFTFYQAGPVALANAVAISHIDLRLKRQGPHPGLLVIMLSGACMGDFALL